MTQIYCFTGLPGAGKSAASSIALDAGYPVVEMGAVVRKKARTALGEDATSEDIGEWATDHRATQGNDVFAKYTADVVRSHVDAGEPIVVIDGLRTPTELAVFRECFEDVTVVYVSASFETRLDRIQSRGREDEGTFGATDLESRDAREREWGVQDLIDTESYDIEVQNESTFDEFADRILGLMAY